MQHVYVQVWNALWDTVQIGPTLQHAVYCDSGFSSFCSASPSKFRDSVVNQSLPPHPVKFIIPCCPLICYRLYIVL